MLLRLSAIILGLIFCMQLSVASTDIQKQKAVLITGATSGIGRLTAEHLAEAGYHVYAGARKQADIDELNKIDNVTAVRLDVTDPEEIASAVEFIEAEGRGLWGLVNNAGVNVLDPLIEADEKDIQFIFDVNVFGVFRVTKAFAPLIIESKGRIVNISSIGGVLAGGVDGLGGYVMSKHAIEAFTDQLAWEVARLGVSVSAIEPGSFESDIGVSRCERMLKNQAKKTYRYYADEMNFYLDDCRKRLAGKTENTGEEPTSVAKAVEHALFADQPKEHYLVTAGPEESRLTIAQTIEEMVQLNRDHEWTLSREDILDILDNEERIARGEQPRTMPGFYGDDAEQ